ncbi:response regulator [Dethiothermospora halolimnae]|uniref:response regulator n=1 Tax=Dethiothermospora halolimnae TaxID=3114390 RepID=UPI003CCB7EF3
MLNVYIIDDDRNIVRILSNIVEDNSLVHIVGISYGDENVIEEILEIKPDIVLIDLLMPNMDGIEIVKNIKQKDSKIKFIMISQVNAKGMKRKAYEVGIEFFINKPINIIEVKKVVSSVVEKIDMERIINRIKNVVGDSSGQIAIKEVEHKREPLTNVKIILNNLGIMGEKGAKDIIKICSYLIKTDSCIYDYNIKDLCKKLTEDNPGSMEQRIRRAINKGLANISHLGIEDYTNTIFTQYSNSVYSFEVVKREMDYIRGKRKSGGKINVKKFIDAIINYRRFNVM